MALVVLPCKGSLKSINSRFNFRCNTCPVLLIQRIYFAFSLESLSEGEQLHNAFRRCILSLAKALLAIDQGGKHNGRLINIEIE